MAEQFAGESQFYVIQVAPQDRPRRIKFGCSKQLRVRLRQHQERWPAAILVKAWPCAAQWEHDAIREATRDSTKIASEVFDVPDLSASLASLDAYLHGKGPSETPPLVPTGRAPQYGLINRIPDLMRERQLTIGALAKGTGLAYGTVRHVVMGHTDRIDLNTIDKLCGYFRVQPDRLFTWMPDAPVEEVAV